MLDPRTHLVLAIVAGIFTAVVPRITATAAIWLLLLVGVAACGRIRAYLRWLRLAGSMALFFGAVTWWAADFGAAALAAVKLATLTTVFFLFFAVTAPEDLANALVKSGLPYSAAFVFRTALQFVPILARKAGDVLDAQRARGLPMEPGWSALRHYPAFFLPLLVQMFQLAEELAEAMEARGFGRPGRTFLKNYRLTWRDWLAIGIGLLALSLWIGITVKNRQLPGL